MEQENWWHYLSESESADLKIVLIRNLVTCLITSILELLKVNLYFFKREIFTDQLILFHIFSIYWKELQLYKKSEDLKEVQSYFSKFSFIFHLKNGIPPWCEFQISVETVKLFGCAKQFSILQLTYILLSLWYM